jgi:REP element-mobilizing transposase RayT
MENMPIGNDTFVTRSRLPHLAKPGKTYYVTFCTQNRKILPPTVRDLTLAICIQFHESWCWVDVVVVMPDHVHVQFTPYDHSTAKEVMWRFKGRSSREINLLLGRVGRFWQRESFDHILRSDEDRFKKAEYIANNPVRAGLVSRREDYPWLWMPETAR